MIYISPERFTNAAYVLTTSSRQVTVNRFLNAISDTQISLLAIDEAHCTKILIISLVNNNLGISEWGVNFRPDYLKVAQMARQFQVLHRNNHTNINFTQAERILVLTATATPTVIDDLCREMDVFVAGNLVSNL